MFVQDYSQPKNDQNNSYYDNESNQLSQMKAQQFNRTVNFIITPAINPTNNQLNIFTGFSITNDGVLRLNSSINQVCFGLQQQQVVKVEELHLLGAVDIQLCRNNYQQEHSINQVLNFINRIPNIPHGQATKCLQKTYKILTTLRTFLSNCVTKFQEEQKNQEFVRFKKLFFAYLEQYRKLYPDQMYQYTIGRLNWNLQDMEYTHVGYSKSYLDFLGIDSQSLTQIFLRAKRIDLIRDKLDITNQTLQGISLRFKDNQYETYISDITTFYGFPSRVMLKKRNYASFLGINKLIGEEYQYEFNVTEIDVYLYDLQQLIQYRQRIIQNQDNLSIDDLIRKELSFLFEDVEYSIQSLQFIQDFYSNNINALSLLEQLKKQDQTQVCRFRAIKQ